MRNTNKYTKLYSGKTPVFLEDDIFQIVIPMGNVAMLQVGPKETDIEKQAKKTSEENKRRKTSEETQVEKTSEEKQAKNISEENKRRKTGEEKQAKKTSDNIKKIIRYLEKHEEAKTKDIAEYLNLSPSRTRAILAKMKNIEAAGATTNRRYRLK